MSFTEIFPLILLALPALCYVVLWTFGDVDPPPFNVVAISGTDATHVSGYCMNDFLGKWTKPVRRSWTTVCLIDRDQFRAIRKKDRTRVLTANELRFVLAYSSRPRYKVCIFRNNELARLVSERAAAARARQEQMKREHELFSSWNPPRDETFVVI